MEAIVSLCALVVAYITFTALKRHNYLSVKPIGYILPKDYEDDLCVILQNKGTGPLITKSIRFINDKSNEEKKHLIDFIPNSSEIIWTNFSMAKKFILTPNEDKILLQYSVKANDQNFSNNRAIIRNALKDIRVVMTYHGVYNDEIQTLDFKLAWYGR